MFVSILGMGGVRMNDIFSFSFVLKQKKQKFKTNRSASAIADAALRFAPASAPFLVMVSVLNVLGEVLKFKS